MPFDRLLSPLHIREASIRNRIFSTGHQTRMIENNQPSDQMVAYHEAREKGGAGLIITEAARVHDSALSDAPAVDASVDGCIPAYRRVVEAVHAYGGTVFGQISHSGRANDRRRGGMRAVPWSASALHCERFHNMSRAMSADMIGEVTDAYANAGARLAEAGVDGLEVMCSHGVLPAQFLNPRSNIRDDAWGGNLENRLRFLTNILTAVRAQVGEGLALGVRISVDEKDHNGLEPHEVVEAAKLLAAHPALDYLNVVAGTMAGLAGSVHVVPPMMIETGYTAPLAALLKDVTDKPIFVAGRINQPQLAEQVLERGEADMIGMTRALIADPEMPNKTVAGQLDDIRACIACNQACIGHFHQGVPVSCIQHPATGREREFGIIPRVNAPRRVLVAGGGPAGLKAAATAAERGHSVTLFESASRLGGQVNLAQLLPGRSEFGGLTTNLEREARQAGVEIRLATPLNRTMVEAEKADTVIIATGAIPWSPAIEGRDEAHIVDAWQVLDGRANVGGRVVIADWRADWIGLGIAELLARNGSHVRLAVNGTGAGQEVQSYVRDYWLGTLHRMDVEIIPHVRLFGADADQVYLQHVLSGEPVICEGVDTLVLAAGHSSVTSLEEDLAGAGVEVHLAGDCLNPRSAEEAVYEGMLAGLEV